MTTTESALPPMAMLQGWLQTARRAPLQDPPGWPQPAQHDAQAALGTAAKDWDLLFRSALEGLARLAVEKPPPAGAGLRLQAPPGHDLAECLQALEQLRQVAWVVAWQQQPVGQALPMAHAISGEAAAPGTPPAPWPDR